MFTRYATKQILQADFFSLLQLGFQKAPENPRSVIKSCKKKKTVYHRVVEITIQIVHNQSINYDSLLANSQIIVIFIHTHYVAFLKNFKVIIYPSFFLDFIVLDSMVFLLRGGRRRGGWWEGGVIGGGLHLMVVKIV